MKTDPLRELQAPSSLPPANSNDAVPAVILAADEAAPAGVHLGAPITGDFEANRALARRLEILSRTAVAIPLLLITGALLFIVNLGAAPIYTKGEAREAVTIFDIVHGGGVILPMRAGVEIPSKPLLMHWLAALISVVAGGVNEWTVRLPSALLAIAGALACYLYVRRLFEERGALLSALMLLTSFQYLQAGTGARVDMTLTFFFDHRFF